MKVSVCLACFNGEKFIREQIDSILIQLEENDELIISDDESTDDTIKIIQSYKDKRIKLIFNQGSHGFVSNFENALSKVKGEIIFLSDQDDVWDKRKIPTIKKYIVDNCLDVVINNCKITNEDFSVFGTEYFTNRHNPVSNGIIGNIISNCWLGCCMAFNRKTLDAVMPFPKDIIAHDYWIGLYANAKLRCGYYEGILQYYRRHDSTTTPAGKKSNIPIAKRIKFRLHILKCLIGRLL